jgi:hypothetical protein
MGEGQRIYFGVEAVMENPSAMETNFPPPFAKIFHLGQLGQRPRFQFVGSLEVMVFQGGFVDSIGPRCFIVAV